jgi:hypothetical protein
MVRESLFASVLLLRILFSGAVSQACRPDSLFACACGPGYTSNVSSTGGNNHTVNASCSPCAPGEYKESTGTSACTSCPAGTSSAQHAATNASTCTQCPDRFYAVADHSACAPCGMDEFCVLGVQVQCETFREHTHTLLPLRNDSADCVCREGRFLSLEHRACVLCTENHYCGGGDNQRASCPLHSYAAPGTEKLQGCVCQRGYFAFTVSSPNASTPECWPCRANTYSGQAQEHFAAECALCPDPGVPPADVSGQASLQNCGPCEKDAAVAPPFCLCPAGSFLTAEQQCAPCSENHVCTGGHASPVGCPPQTMFVPVGHGRSMDDCLCTAGFFRVDNQDALAEGILQNIVRPEDVGSSR